MFKGKVIISSQLTGTITGEELTEGLFLTEKEAIQAAKELSREIEKYYSVYSNHDYKAISASKFCII